MKTKNTVPRKSVKPSLAIALALCLLGFFALIVNAALSPFPILVGGNTSTNTVPAGFTNYYAPAANAVYIGGENGSAGLGQVSIAVNYMYNTNGATSVATPAIVRVAVSDDYVSWVTNAFRFALVTNNAELNYTGIITNFTCGPVLWVAIEGIENIGTGNNNTNLASVTNLTAKLAYIK